jgi:hypothetical protein
MRQLRLVAFVDEHEAAPIGVSEVILRSLNKKAEEKMTLWRLR